MWLVGTVTRDVQDNVFPFLQEFSLGDGVVQFHRVGQREPLNQIDEMLDRLVVSDVRPVVEVGKEDQVADGVQLRPVFRIGDRRLRRMSPDDRLAWSTAVDAVPSSFDHYGVVELPVGQQLDRRKEQRHVHAVLFEQTHDGHLIRYMNDTAMSGEIGVLVARVFPSQRCSKSN